MEELEMYETLKYIKDRFEEENEGLCFSYLGADEKRKDTLYECMELEKGDEKRLSVSTSIGNCWRLPRCSGVRFFDIKHFSGYNRFPDSSCRFVDVTGEEGVIWDWFKRHYESISDEGFELDLTVKRIGKYLKFSPNYFKKLGLLVDYVTKKWPTKYLQREYKVKYIPTYYEYFDGDEYFESKVVEIKIPVLVGRYKRDLSVLLQVRKNLESEKIELRCATRTLRLGGTYPELDTINNEVCVSIKSLDMTGGSVELKDYVEDLVVKEISDYLLTTNNTDTKELESIVDMD
jgi:hypothetical protein